MKKSANIALALLGTTVLGACTPQGDAQTGAFKSIDQCQATGKFSYEDCSKSFVEANRERQLNGPSYSSKEECQRENKDGCEQSSRGHASGSGRYIPLHSFYMVGQNAHTTNGVHYPAVQSQPLYERAGQGLTNNAGDTVTAKPGSFTLSSKSSALNRSSSVKSTTSSRGGIGSIGGGRGISS